jgi:flavin prenyltransferase
MLVGVTGASGIIYAVRLLEMLRDLQVESHLIITKAAEQACVYETDLSVRELRDLGDRVYAPSDVGAAISSGSFSVNLGMVVAPCSVRSLSDIAYGNTSNLLTRAADVTLKERRRLVLVMRETPLHAGHLKAMLAATESGAIIAPPVPAFYTRPTSLDEIVTHRCTRPGPIRPAPSRSQTLGRGRGTEMPVQVLGDRSDVGEIICWRG